ncbi:MAG: flavin reductase family protein [Syntrophorhabdales bacterium]|jgi:flavin reductase (DIM6/NTAB) family NADH-FMN oxidoreductase RutF
MKQSLGAKIVVGATTVWVVGTYDKEGRPNLMTAAWGGVCCSDPPCVGVSLRKATYTYGSIKDRNAFTVSIPSVKYAQETDYVGIASGRDTDKWQVTGLTPVRGNMVDAPYVGEFPLVLECRLLHALDLGLHTRFIGEVLDVKADASVLSQDGMLDIEKTNPFFYIAGNRTYYEIGRYLGKAHSIGAQLRKTRA